MLLAVRIQDFMQVETQFEGACVLLLGSVTYTVTAVREQNGLINHKAVRRTQTTNVKRVIYWP